MWQKRRFPGRQTGSVRSSPPAQGRLLSAAGITDLQRVSLRDDRAPTLVFSAASAPVSYLCAGMIGIHYRPPLPCRAPRGGIRQLSPSLNGIRLSPSTESETCASQGGPSGSHFGGFLLTEIRWHMQWHCHQSVGAKQAIHMGICSNVDTEERFDGDASAGF